MYDFYFFISGRISKKQFVINTILTGSLMVGGSAGWYAGQEAIGGIIVENTLLWFAVCFLSSGVVGYVFERVATVFVVRSVSSDAEDITDVFNSEFDKLKSEYNLTHEQACTVASTICLDDKVCLDCFKTRDKRHYADTYLRTYFDNCKLSEA